MKTLTIALSGFILTSLIFSCQKEDLSTPDQLQLDLESCKSKDKKQLFIGKEYQGGIIFYLDETGKHGLIAAKEDLGPAPWGCTGTSIPEAQGQEIGDGEKNTKAILKACKEPGIAARLCAKYIVREKGENERKYDDWFLPSFSEFREIGYALKNSSLLTCNETYTNSSEYAGSWMNMQRDPRYTILGVWVGCSPDLIFSGFMPLPTGKSANLLVRPIRKF